jgi:hypothetical protein
VDSAPVGVKANNKPVVVLTQCGIIADGTGQWKASLMSSQNDSGISNKMRVHNGGTVSPMRSSKRNATTSDQDSLEKATKLKASKNLDSAPGKGKGTIPSSFHTLDDSILLARTKSLGIILGDNEQAMSLSLNSLRDLEALRMNGNDRVEEEKKIVLDDVSTVCSIEDNIDLEALNLICSEISEGFGDGGCDPLCLQTPLSQNKRSRSRYKKKPKYQFR